MTPFELAEPATLKEAIALLDPDDPTVRPIAGGTALMLMMKAGVFRPEKLVSLRNVKGLTAIEPMPDGALRIGAMFLLGVLPGLFALWLRTGIPESPPWERSNEQRRAAREKHRAGAPLAEEEQALVRFTVVDLFVEPEIRRRTILVFLGSLTTTLA